MLGLGLRMANPRFTFVLVLLVSKKPFREHPKNSKQIDAVRLEIAPGVHSGEERKQSALKAVSHWQVIFGILFPRLTLRKGET